MQGVVKKGKRKGAISKLVGVNYDERIFTLDVFDMIFSYCGTSRDSFKNQKFIMITVKL
jgi:hypothetical protein